MKLITQLVSFVYPGRKESCHIFAMDADAGKHNPLLLITWCDAYAKDIMEVALTRQSVRNLRIDGSHSQQQRERTLAAFKQNDKV
jgi:hypothetical protein